MESYHGASTPLFKGPLFVQLFLMGQCPAKSPGCHPLEAESEMASQERQQYSTCAQDGVGSRVWSLSPATESLPTVYTVYHVQARGRQEQKCTGLGQGPKGGSGHREGW